MRLVLQKLLSIGKWIVSMDELLLGDLFLFVFREPECE